MNKYSNTQKIKEELFDLLDPEIGAEVGNDDMVYGNYIEWPYLDDLDYNTQLAIADILNVTITGNKDEDYSNLIDAGYEEGTEFEQGNDNFLNSARYYYFDDIDDDYYLDNLDINLAETYINKLKNIENNIMNSNDDIIKISLLNSAFSLTESFISNMIRSKIPKYDEVHEDLKKLIKITIDNQSKSFYGRKLLFKIFYYDYSLEQYEYNELRNILAHNMNICSFKNQEIIYPRDSFNDEYVNVYDVIEKLKLYINEVYEGTQEKYNDFEIERLKNYIQSNTDNEKIKNLIIDISRNRINITRNNSDRVLITTQNRKSCTIYDLIPYVYNNEYTIDSTSKDYSILNSLIIEINSLIFDIH